MPPLTSRFTRYVAKQLVVGTLLVSGGLVFVVWLTQSLRFLQMVMGKGLSIATWIELTLLMLPSSLALILPIALFAVVAFVYNKLSVDRELVVVQAAGMSRMGLAGPAIACGVAATIVGFILNLAAVPAAMRSFKDLQWSVRNDISQLLLRAGTFNQVAPGLTIYVRDQAPDGTLLGLLIHDRRQRERTVTLMAERATAAENVEGSAITLLNGSRQERGADSGFTTLTFDTYTVDFGALGAAGEDRWLDNGERDTVELLLLTEADGHTATSIRRMRADAHQRLAAPFLNLSFAMIAVAWLLIGGIDRRGAVPRVLGATATMVIVQVAVLGAAALAAQDGVWLIAIYAVCLLPGMVGSAVLSQARRGLIATRPGLAGAR